MRWCRPVIEADGSSPQMRSARNDVLLVDRSGNGVSAKGSEEHNNDG